VSTYTSAAYRRRAREESDFHQMLGFSPLAIPLVIALGLVFLMVTVPDFFQVLARWGIGNGFTRGTFTFLNEQASAWKSALRAEGLHSWVHSGLMGIFFGVPILLLAAALRSALVRKWQPLGITSLAFGLGVVSIPVVTWIAEFGVLLYRLGVIVYDAIVRFFAWIAPVLAVLVLIAIGLAALWGLVSLVIHIHRRNWWLGLTVVLALAGALAYAISQGWLDDFLMWVAELARLIGAWIATYLGPIVAWIIQAVIFLIVLIMMAGGFLAGFGQVGRTLWLPLKAATTAGRDQAKCADAAAGIGVALSLLLTAATMNQSFQNEFAAAWQATPGVNRIPVPLSAFDFLLRDKAEAFLARGFGDFNPFFDVMLLVLLFVVAIGSLLFQHRAWTPGDGSKVAVPVMVGLGLALAVAIPLLLLSVLTGGGSDS
jgi:hypothetical protein